MRLTFFVLVLLVPAIADLTAAKLKEKKVKNKEVIKKIVKFDNILFWLDMQFVNFVF